MLLPPLPPSPANLPAARVALQSGGVSVRRVAAAAVVRDFPHLRGGGERRLHWTDGAPDGSDAAAGRLSGTDSSVR